MIRCLPLAVAVCLVCAVSAAADRPLLNVSEGQKPNDTAFENRTRLSIEPGALPGGKALKVVLAEGDSFGMSRAGIRDWSSFEAITFDAWNPGQQTVEMILTVKHRGTTSVATRAEQAFTLKPGKNSVRIDLKQLRNGNGSRPDLAAITHWYIHCPAAAPTLFFGDFLLAGGDGSRPSGKAASRTVKTDPKRLQRIRSATMPRVSAVVEFHTPEADAILSALEVFPPDNPWNEVVDEWPLHPDSDRIIASIGADKPFRGNADMGFLLVPPDQRKIDVAIVSYPGQSDKGPYPVPENIPIEGWPASYQRSGQSRLTLRDVQFDRQNEGGDRHAIVIDPTRRVLYEFYRMKRTGSGWQAAQASI